MGYDFSGVVEKLSESDANKPFSVGDEVFAVNWGNAKHDDESPSIGGAFAQYISIPISKLSKKPASLSHELAAAVALVGTTAYQGLDQCKATKGTKILILGGSSAVGFLAIQLAKSRGCWVATTCSSRTYDYVKQTKPDRIINYQEEKWDELPDLKELDAVYDTVNESDWFNRARDKKVVRSDGYCLTITSGDLVGFNPNGHPPLAYASFFCLSNDSKIQDELAAMLVDGSLLLTIDQRFPFTLEGVKDMLVYIKGGKSCGKNVINDPSLVK